MPQVSDEYRDERRAQLVAAARRCFVRRGFHATSMKDVLTEAGMSAGAAYGYFAGKDDIILAVAEDNMRGIEDALAHINAGEGEQTPAAALQQLLATIRTRDQADEFAKVAVIVWSEAIRNPALREALLRLSGQYRNTFETLAAAILDDAVPARPVATTVMALAITYILQLALDAPAPIDEMTAPVDRLCGRVSSTG